jgi:hypothetical protein
MSGNSSHQVRGLVQSVKEYKWLTIRVANEQSRELTKLALLIYPLIGQWQPAEWLPL